MIILRTVKKPFSSLNIAASILLFFDGYFGGRYC